MIVNCTLAFHSFPDVHVRQVAINWLSEKVLDDDLVDFLPQLLEALKHETWATSPLAKLLLKRSLVSPRLAHSLYWLLTQSLPGSSPQVRVTLKDNSDLYMNNLGSHFYYKCNIRDILSELKDL